MLPNYANSYSQHRCLRVFHYIPASLHSTVPCCSRHSWHVVLCYQDNSVTEAAFSRWCACWLEWPSWFRYVDQSNHCLWSQIFSGPPLMLAKPRAMSFLWDHLRTAEWIISFQQCSPLMTRPLPPLIPSRWLLSSTGNNSFLSVTLLIRVYANSSFISLPGIPPFNVF